MSQDICLGDVLIGDDGEMRVVEQVFSGEDELYEVNQNKGQKYTVNSKHTLVLKFIGNDTVAWKESINRWSIRWFDVHEKRSKTKLFKVTPTCDKEATKLLAEEFLKSLHIESVILLTVDEYQQLDTWSKKYLYGYKSSSGVNYKEQDISLDPYMLGLWLGDGTHTRPEIASNDSEIQDYILRWCSMNDAELVKEYKYKLRIRRKGYTNGKVTVDGIVYENKQTVEDKSNPFTNELKKYSLIGNKHIPIEYMMNSRENRLKLLAGIIDTDGHVPKDQNGKRVVILQTREILTKQIIKLAKSLGFYVNVTIRERKNMKIFGCDAKDYKDLYLINISGKELGDIPTILPRKKCIGSNTNKDYFRTGIDVVPVGKGTYYGWTIDGNSRFILDDFTVLRNCDQMWCTQCHTAFNWRTGRIESVVHNPHYFEWLRRNGNAIPRNPGDIPCQNELTHTIYSDIRNRIHDHFPQHPLRDHCDTYLSRTIRNILHMRHVTINEYDIPNRAAINERLRVQYMRRRISEENFKITLQRMDKRIEKKRETRDIITLLLTTSTDIILRFYNKLRDETNPELDGKILDELKPIVDYANECLLEIGKVYVGKTIQYTYEFSIK
jgi:hypothetical protein